MKLLLQAADRQGRWIKALILAVLVMAAAWGAELVWLLKR